MANQNTLEGLAGGFGGSYTDSLNQRRAESLDSMVKQSAMRGVDANTNRTNFLTEQDKAQAPLKLEQMQLSTAGQRETNKLIEPEVAAKLKAMDKESKRQQLLAPVQAQEEFVDTVHQSLMMGKDFKTTMAEIFASRPDLDTPAVRKAAAAYATKSPQAIVAEIQQAKKAMADFRNSIDDKTYDKLIDQQTRKDVARIQADASIQGDRIRANAAGSTRGINATEAKLNIIKQMEKETDPTKIANLTWQLNALNDNANAGKYNIVTDKTEGGNIIPPPPRSGSGAKAPNIESLVKAQGESYEPTKYDYRVSPEGKVQRKLKGK